MLSIQFMFDHRSIKENCSKVREAQNIRFAFIVYERPFTIRVLWGDMPLLSDPGFEYCGWAGCYYWLWSHPHSAFLVVLTAHLPVSKFHLTSLGLGPSWFEKKKKSIEDWTDSMGWVIHRLNRFWNLFWPVKKSKSKAKLELTWKQQI